VTRPPTPDQGNAAIGFVVFLIVTPLAIWALYSAGQYLLNLVT
jgi:hypothetical protein